MSLIFALIFACKQVLVCKIVIFLLTVDGTSLRLARIIALEMKVAGMIIQASISSRTIMTTNRNPS